MAISKTPKRRASEKKVEALINKGGASPKGKPPKRGRELKYIQLRIPQSTVNIIDGIIDQNSSDLVKKSRHQWLLEAIQEKINRETKQ